jgi:glycosyltransferase involved in cell wall biosynthesis
MRVLQLIDSSKPGGAERMAVLYANSLASSLEGSHFCCTRIEGILGSELNKNVHYLYLQKRSTLDILAIIKLRNYIIKHRINLIHAHSSSYFLACLMKVSLLNIKIIWHDHYGNSDFLNDRRFLFLKVFSFGFDGIISVNQNLKNWAFKNLFCKKIVQINNFCKINFNNKKSSINLKGNVNATKFICVANLRPQKDHLTLIKAFEIWARNKNVSLHLIGGDPNTTYSRKILRIITQSKLKNKLFYYGPKINISSYLKLSDIAVLSSSSEGLPVALLEYGIAGLPVISSDVGKCKEVIGGHGILVKPNSIKSLCNALDFYYNNEELRVLDAHNLKKRISENFSENKIMNKVLNFYKDITSN